MRIRCHSPVLVANIFGNTRFVFLANIIWIFLLLPADLGIPSRMTKSFISNSNVAAMGSSSAVTESIPAMRTFWSVVATLRAHWPEYLMESAELAMFMISACVVTAILEHPASPLRDALPNDLTRRFITGLAMGITLLSLVHSNW